jgi:hypothetical protein
MATRVVWPAASKEVILEVILFIYNVSAGERGFVGASV